MELNPSSPDTEATQAQEPEVSPSGPASIKRNQHLKSDDPKCVQFGGRATKSEAERLKEAIELRKQPGKTYDVVRLAIDMMDHIEKDVFQTFKTKKKR